MSVEAMAIVLHHSRAQGTDKLILLGIANHDGDGGAWPAIATLARYANIQPRGVKKVLRRLEALGELRTEKNRGGTLDTNDFERPNRYHVLVACPDDCDRTKNHRPIRPGGVSAGTPGGVSAGTPGGVSARTPEPSNEPSDEPRAAAFRVVEPPVTREPATPTTTKSTIQPTPDQKLEAAGLASPSDRGRFREFLRTVKGARSTEAVIVAATPEDLASQVAEWRRSLDVAAEPDAEPVLCEHGHDVALGAHMCPACDPARQRAAAPSHDVEPDHGGAPMPEWVREALTGAPALAVPGAFGAPDETTRYGVTPSILAGATSGAHGAA